MTRFKTKALILTALIILMILSTTGCALVVDLALDVLLDDSDSEQSSQLSREANIKGLELLDEDMFEESIVYFEEAIDHANKYLESLGGKRNKLSNELFGDAYNNLCLVYNALYDYETGLEYENLAYEVSKDSAYVYSNRGNSYSGLGMYTEALQDYDKAIEIDSKDSFAYYGKGLVYFEQEEYEKSLAEFQKSSDIVPYDIDTFYYMIQCYYYLEDYDMGIKLSDKAIRLEKDFDIYYLKGLNIQGKQGYEDAENYYKEVLSRFRNEAEAHISLGRFYYDNGNYKKALEYLISIKEKFNSSQNLHNWIISCYIAMDDTKGADVYFQTISSEGNSTVDICNFIGEEFTYSGYYMESIKYFDEAIRIDADDKQAYINKLYSLYYGKRFSRCIEFGKIASEKFKDNYDILFYIGDSYYNLSDFEEALKWYESALNVRPDNDTILSYISDTYAMAEDYENAKEYANKALAINRSNYIAQNVKSTIEQRQTSIEDRIIEFIKTDYLYYDKEKDIDHMFQSDMSNEDISRSIDAVKNTDDIFTFCLYDNYYDEYYEAYMENIEYVDYEYMKYIRIYDFNQETDDQVVEILDSIEEPENTVLTIDLRMNGGGHTLAANNILDALLASCVTCTLIDRDGYTYNYYSDASQIKFRKIFILVDEESASASELLTLGLKTFLNNVTIVGTNTYGKGVGQNVYEDRQKNLMVFLVNHYWNVREQNIKDVGITPDVYVKSDKLTDYIDVVKKMANM
ncbi:tetratricopeptide repeat protein [Sedimentibacter sp.]|uniref:tetratricopeptide repeat protein n=1 Tax=Sedimentibacter sp. TaxID=1960295 RepID=UPI00289A03C9|nr:tetratricopeptide repeat protein [Sedimentibacter sp.]